MKNKRRLATVLGFVMVFTMIFSLKTPMNVNAGNVSHVRLRRRMYVLRRM